MVESVRRNAESHELFEKDVKLLMVDQMFTSPSRYVQGIDLLERAAEYIQPLGKTPLIIADEVVWDIAGKKLQESLKQDGLEAGNEIFGG